MDTEAEITGFVLLDIILLVELSAVLAFQAKMKTLGNGEALGIKP
jgi:hypothetical protein